MNEYNARASTLLMILGEDLDPDMITRTLGMFPHRSWRRGELPDVRVNVQRFPAGVPAERGCWKMFPPEHVSDQPLEDQLNYWKEALTPKLSAIQQLSSFGWEIVIDCLFWTVTTELIELASDLMLFFSEQNINIDLHFFADA